MPVSLPRSLQDASVDTALTATERRIADHLSLIWAEIPMVSAAEVAQELGVNPSSVTRFAQTLGYKGYPDLQRAARLELRQQHQPVAQPGDSEATAHWSREIAVFEALAALPEEDWDEAAELLAAARRVRVTGARGSEPVAAYAAQIWGTVRPEVHFLPARLAEVEHWLDTGPHDLLVAFTFKRYARQTAELIQATTELGSRLLLITDSHAAPGARAASLKLILPVPEGQFMSLTATVSLCSLLAAKLTGKVGQERLRTVEKILGEQDVFTY